MRSIWIFILISIVINIVSSIGKANQKKRTMPSSVKKTKETDYNYKSRDMMPEVKENDSNNRVYNSSTTTKGLDYDQATSFSYETEEAASIQNESIEYSGKVFDIGLSELQLAIVMTEVMNKPLALRKR